jgi:predicted Fe-S protein YdhL (DUF1289 family)
MLLIPLLSSRESGLKIQAPIRMSKINNPCIRLCTLSEQDICIGCGRLIIEIKEWASYTDEQRTAILKRLENKQDTTYRHKYFK